MVPVFLGSSFAFIPALAQIIAKNPDNIPLAQSGVIAAGLVYLVFSVVAKFAGADRIRKIFPAVVTGPIIIIIGLGLTGVALKDAMNWWDGSALGLNHFANAMVALFTFCVMAFCMNSRKGLVKLIPILISIVCGYVLFLILSRMFPQVFSMGFDPIKTAPWVNIPYQTPGFLSMPKLDWTAILTIAPIAIVTFMEHIGDITTNGAVVGQDFFKNPGLHRTLLGDGVATAVAGFLGGPANTTYSENTGVLATTKNYNPVILRVAAILAIILGCIGKLGAVLETIPVPVKGGIEIMLFGMIASIGIRTIVEAKLDMTSSRNLCVMAATLCTGVGLVTIGGIPLCIKGVNVNLSALFVATFVGVILNLILPHETKKEEAKKNK